MKKINIAEILKNCPTGMELDCTMYEDVYFDYVDELNNIRCYIQQKFNKTSVIFNQDGTPNSHTKSKCVIFPKGETTWEGFAPPCKFKDGDIISNGRYVAIFHKTGKPEGYVNSNVVYYHCWYNNKYTYKEFKSKIDFGIGCIEEYKYATEKEKQKLFDAIKLHGYKWNPETKTLEKLIEPKFKVGDKVRHKNNHNVVFTISSIEEDSYVCGGKMAFCFNDQDDWELVPNKFDITTLKPFDRVLMRSSNAREWVATFYSHYSNNKFYGCGMCCDQCIPYKKNEHLLGTTNDCDEYFKNWE